MSGVAKSHDSIDTEDDSPYIDIKGIPLSIVWPYTNHTGIKALYDWQQQFLELEAVQNHENMILSVPGFGGKSTVADLLALRELFCAKRDVLMMMSCTDAVVDKVQSFKILAEGLNFDLLEYADQKGKIPPVRKGKTKQRLYIGTVEKTARLVDSLLTEKRMEEVGLLIVDGLHFIGESGGEILESLLVKVLFSKASIQIVALCRPIGNITELCTFLHAREFTNKQQRSDLLEWSLCGSSIGKRREGDKLQPFEVDRSVDPTVSDPDYVACLMSELISKGPCLILCPTCEVAEHVTELVASPDNGCRDTLGNEHEQRKALLGDLSVEWAGWICPILVTSINWGVAYYHEGQTATERNLIKQAFTKGVLRCLVATTSLAMRVSLTAKSVIIKGPFVGSKFLTPSQYKNMVGAAGQTDIALKGESYLMFKEEHRLRVAGLLSRPLERCSSQLGVSNRLPELMHSSCVVGLVNSDEQIRNLVKHTLHSITSGTESKDLDAMLKEAIDKLIRQGVLARINSQSGLVASRFGVAIQKSNLTIDDGISLLTDLKQAGTGLYVNNDLHLLYLLTPYRTAAQIPWQTGGFSYALAALEPEELAAIERIGFKIETLQLLNTSTSHPANDEQAIRKLYCCLILYWLWRDLAQIWHIAPSYEVQRGQILELQTATQCFQTGVIQFCEALESFPWAVTLFNEMTDRIRYGPYSGLKCLLRLPNFSMGRARQLVEAGLTSIEEIASADVTTLESRIAHLSRDIAEEIITSAKKLLATSRRTQ